jgi:uncharacterized protein with HEPN domain
MARNPVERDAALLLDMLLAARDAVAFVEGMDETAFMKSRLHQNAVVRALEVLGEAANRVSPGFRTANPGIPWRETTAMRNRLIHGYADIRFDLVWTVVRSHLPPLISALTPLVPPDEGRTRQDVTNS